MAHTNRTAGSNVQQVAGQFGREEERSRAISSSLADAVRLAEGTGPFEHEGSNVVGNLRRHENFQRHHAGHHQVQHTSVTREGNNAAIGVALSGLV